MSKTIEQIQKELAEPFPPSVISWRPGMVRGEESDRPQCLAFAYVQAGAVMDRFDEVVGIASWSDSYETAPNPEKATDPAVMCTIQLCIEGQWISKADVAENTDVEGVKGGFSDSFKRAAVKWGVGRYLKRLPPQWAPCIKRGKSWVIAPEWEPKLPRWALPGGGPMQEPQPRQPEAEGIDQLPGGESVDKATGEVHASPPPAEPSHLRPAPYPPKVQPAPTAPGDTQSEWNALCRLMQSNKLNSQMVGHALGGNFNKNAFEAWLERGTNRSAQVLIDEIVSDRSRAAAVTG